jgi:hypothetical protein
LLSDGELEENSKKTLDRREDSNQSLDREEGVDEKKISIAVGWWRYLNNTVDECDKGERRGWGEQGRRFKYSGAQRTACRVFP